MSAIGDRFACKIAMPKGVEVCLGVELLHGVEGPKTTLAFTAASADELAFHLETVLVDVRKHVRGKAAVAGG